jgi:hypothetical protein
VPQAKIYFRSQSGQAICRLDIGTDWVGSDCGVELKSNWPPYTKVTSETNKPARVALTSLSINENRVKGWLALQNEPSGHQFKTEVVSIFGDAESSCIAVFPNPFQNKTCISYYLKEQSKVTVQITDINGKLVKTIANEVQNEGINELSWNGDNDQKQQLPQGVYFAVFKSENIMEVKRVVLIR